MGTQGFSPRARSDAQLVRLGATSGSIRLRGTSEAAPLEVEVTLDVLAARRARLNGDSLRTAEQLRHRLCALVFTPDRLAVVKGGPAARRAYLDRSLGRLFPSRAALPVEYAAAVGQRNAALRRLAARASSPAALAPWTHAVATLGRELVSARAETIALLAEPFRRCAELLGLPDARLAYGGDPPTIAELDARLGRDLERGATGAGPHLHDVEITAAGRDLRRYGSQGEQRVAVLALVLAEAATLHERGGAAPLLLLDDVLSELDEGRRLALAEIVSGSGQTVVTATASSALPVPPAQELRVAEGRVRSAA